ncbi:MAG: flippase-like domain-containing protein [Bacteroides sp.]|nr:flippase-like domain-containing protein [Bacteroides sp.]
MNTHNAPRHRPARNIITEAIKIIVPLVISAGMVVWLFHKVDYHQVESIIRQGVDYRFIVGMMCVTVISHIIRGIRWGIQLRAAGVPRMPVIAESVSIFGAYALNLLFPFLGEAWRCIYVSRREKCKLATVVGTDIGDRASDGIMISMITGLAIIVAHPAMVKFMNHYHLGQTLRHTIDDGRILLWLIGIVAILFLVGYFLRNTALMANIKASCNRIWQGFAILFHLKSINLYLVLTIGIWACYFMETYLCFYAFPFTRALIHTPGSAWGLVPGLVVFVFGSCSMIVPSNGGLGPWNIAVMFALSLYGVSDTEGAAYSIICWSFQSATLIGLGIFSAFYIIHTRHRDSSSAIKKSAA